MRMVEGRIGADAHEFLDADVDGRHALHRSGNGELSRQPCATPAMLRLAGGLTFAKRLEHGADLCKMDEIKLSQKPVRR